MHQCMNTDIKPCDLATRVQEISARKVRTLIAEPASPERVIHIGAAVGGMPVSQSLRSLLHALHIPPKILKCPKIFSSTLYC